MFELLRRRPEGGGRVTGREGIEAELESAGAALVRAICEAADD
jgi:hypothetical protein